MHQCVCKSVYMHLRVYITVNTTEKSFQLLYICQSLFIYSYTYFGVFVISVRILGHAVHRHTLSNSQLADVID